MLDRGLRVEGCLTQQNATPAAVSPHECWYPVEIWAHCVPLSVTLSGTADEPAKATSLEPSCPWLLEPLQRSAAQAPALKTSGGMTPPPEKLASQASHQHQRLRFVCRAHVWYMPVVMAWNRTPLDQPLTMDGDGELRLG